MHDWSTKGFHSGFMTTDQMMKGYRQTWEESCDQGRTNTNFKTVNTCGVGDIQKPSGVIPQIVKDDGISRSFCSKKKRGISDPRFKRIINVDVKKDNETDVTKKKLPVSDDGAIKDKLISLLKPPKDITYAQAMGKITEPARKNHHTVLIELATKDPGFQVPDAQIDCHNKYSKKPQNNLKNCRKLKKDVKSGLKKSASDCTLNVINIHKNENDAEFQKLRPYPSGTQLVSGTNWGKGAKVDKKRSVVTVIGQTQTKPISELFEEINQRRKLAKELDRHALCEAIMESNDSQTDVKNLVAKVDFVLPNGKVLYSREKVYVCKDKHKDCGEYQLKSRDTSEDEFRKRRDMIPERDSSISQVDKRSRLKRCGKKSTAPSKESTQLKEKATFLRRKLVWVFFLIVFFLACTWAWIHYTKPSRTYYYFLQRLFVPQSLSWYEKVFR